MGRRSKDKRDVYYRKAKQVGYRARSAFKLLQLDARFDFFRDACRVVDLCAAPGSWSQVVAQRMDELGRGAALGPGGETKDRACVVAVDLQEMAPIQGVHILQGDITQEATIERISSRFDGALADIVISDGAPDVTGVHDIDEYVQAELIFAALGVAVRLLKEGGTFVAKVFRQQDTELLYGRLRVFFTDVVIAKPQSSRNSSIEAFVVCREFTLPPNFERSVPFRQGLWREQHCNHSQSAPNAQSGDDETPAREHRIAGAREILMPFVACGDLSAFDADMNYDLSDSDPDLAPLAPVQPPINPPYAHALAQLRLSSNQNHAS
uniref:Putative tRNA (cytidine(32)/guanosine(34)-2'-O)-methyltransferase n=1 Tax=Erythrolobus australicus TaxID=1077150 RepID=A0A7S1TL31_9RHOD